MDISALLSEYLANAATESYSLRGIMIGFAVALVVGLPLMFWASSSVHAKNDSESDDEGGGLYVIDLVMFTLVFVFAGVGLVVGGNIGENLAEKQIGSSWEDYRASTLSALADDVESTYDVVLSDKNFSEAFTAALEEADSSVVSFSGEREGQRKALGLQIDQSAGELTLYEGNTALEPVGK